MVAHRHITKTIVALMAVAVVLCFLAAASANELTGLMGGLGVRMEYETKLFNTDKPIRIDIQMDEDAWNGMLANVMSEEYHVCDVVINGKKISSVAIRPKGNTSLSAIAMDPDSERYSLKLEFDHFVEGQTCFGLDKLILNNNYADATNMKEAVVYDMFRYLGADASLYNYAEVYVNGEYRGVYLALEAVEQSFMLRNFGTQDGKLYKPDTMDVGGGDASSGGSAPKGGGMDLSGADLSDFAGKAPPSGGRPGGGDNAQGDGGMPSFGGLQGGDFSFDPNDLPSDFDMSDPPEGFDMGSRPGSDGAGAPGASASSDSGGRPAGGGGMSMGGGGANLNYTDDELDSYSTIWEGEVTGAGTADHRRVVTALKNISEGVDLETYLDVDNVLKYMAVHVFAVNMDSLSGSMAHNYYLYEYNGQLNIFPWDYNLSFGGMSMGGSGSATNMVNDAIDTPFSGTRFFDALLENEEYLARYHAYLQQLTDEYVNGGRFDEVYDRIRSQIDPLVQTDPTAFYSYDAYLTAAELLYRTVKLRAESIQGQLDGSIPSTDAGQRQNAAALIDASDIDVKAMGQFNMGGSFTGRSDSGAEDASEPEESPSAEPEQPAEAQPPTDEAQQPPTDETQTDMGSFDPGNMPDMGRFDPGSMPDMGSFDPGNMPDMGSFDPNSMPDMGSFDPNSMPDMGASSPDAENDGQTAPQVAEDDTAQNGPAGDAAAQPDGNRPSFSGGTGRIVNLNTVKNGVAFAVCMAVMLAALAAVCLFKRRK